MYPPVMTCSIQKSIRGRGCFFIAAKKTAGQRSVHKTVTQIISTVVNGSAKISFDTGYCGKRSAVLGIFSINFVMQYVALKIQIGEIVDRELSISSMQEGYFYVPVVQEIIVADECKALDEYLGCKNVASTHYDDFEYYKALNEEDIECRLMGKTKPTNISDDRPCFAYY